jgi:glycerophosphoryl diester phosphodiesterase
MLVCHRTPATASACREAARAGASTFELDLQLNGDRLVVSHFLPLVWVRGWLENDNWKLRWHGRGLPDPTFEDVVRLIPEGCRILVDPKETRAPRKQQLRDRIVSEVQGDDRFIVSTSDVQDLEVFRRYGICTWRTIGSSGELRRAMADNRFDFDGISVRHTLVTPRTLEWLSGRSGAVVAWTVNHLGRARELASMGIAGVTTDRVDIVEALSKDDIPRSDEDDTNDVT